MGHGPSCVFVALLITFILDILSYNQQRIGWGHGLFMIIYLINIITSYNQVIRHGTKMPSFGG